MAGYFRLVRPANLALVVAAVLLGGTVSGGGFDSARLWAAAAAAALVAAAGYVANDLRDVARDRVDKPWRPLAAGKARRPVAVRLAAGSGVAGWALAWTAGPRCGLLVSAWILLLALYEAGLKRRMLWGNLVVSAVCGSAFLLGGLAVGRPAAALVPGGFGLLYHLAREMWKDAADARGDGATGARTLAVVRGPRAALQGASLALMVLVVLSPFPYVTGLYNAAYLAVVIALDVLLVWLVVTVSLRPTRLLAARTAGVLKLGMGAGLCAIALGAL